MKEVRVEAVNDDDVRWVGHGVGATEQLAEAQAKTRMPVGYAPVTSELTRQDVDPETIHWRWVNPETVEETV